ncbi:MAG: hypothetical protein HYZ95_03480 [Candidatus Omnitrophica bacterium]|nr:hypothetical protein [Candidatus Omnitrophota bacterium]
MRDPWALGSLGILLAAAILSAAHWPAYPYFLDHYYHLAAAQGFRDAGGLVLHAFWEQAPDGRPQLYPPLFHLLSLPALQAGLHPITLARFWSWASFPLLLLVARAALVRILPSSRGVCLALAALAAPYSFFLGCVNYLPATLALAAGLGLALALHERRWLAGGLLLGLSFWLHAGFSGLLALAVGLFALFDPSRRKTALAALAIGAGIGAPWLIHMARHLSLLRIQPRGEERFLETPLLLLALSLPGLKICWDRGGTHRFFVALAVGFLPMLAAYRFRFLATQGLLPFLILAGITLEAVVERARAGWLRALVPVSILLGSFTLQGSGGERWRWIPADTMLSTLSGLQTQAPRSTAEPLYNDRLMTELAGAVRERAGEEDLVFSNVSYVGGMLNVLTGRATTNQMLREMAERPLDDQIRPARVVVWLKSPAGGASPGLGQAVQRHGLRYAGETEMAYLYLNPSAAGRRRKGAAAVPGWAASAAILLCVGTAAWDLRGRRFRSRCRSSPA